MKDIRFNELSRSGVKVGEKSSLDHNTLIEDKIPAGGNGLEKLVQLLQGRNGCPALVTGIRIARLGAQTPGGFGQ